MRVAELILVTLLLTLPAAAQPFTVELSLLNGENGSYVTGRGIDLLTGASVAAAGDVNGDGRPDLIIGAIGEYLTGKAGEAYVIFGSDDLPLELKLGDLDGENGFRIDGNLVESQAGNSVASIGDFNGDGFDDVVLGAPQAEPERAGAVYVVLGRADFPAVLDVSDLDGANGFILHGERIRDYLGTSVASACDVNRDGFDDFLAGATGWEGPDGYRNGRAYVVLGGSAPLPASTTISELDAERVLFINGHNDGDESGSSVGCAGDLNDDGYSDVVVGSWGVDEVSSNGGAASVIFGSPTPQAVTELSELDGSNGFEFRGTGFWAQAGARVTPVGDFNADGIDDLAVAAPEAAGRAGEVYVIYGSHNFPAVTLSDDLDGANGVTIRGETEQDISGIGLGAGADMNGDGVADLLIGAGGADPNRNAAGRAYVVHGRPGLPAVVELAELNGFTGVAFNGFQSGGHVGRAVSGIGDINGDGADDFAIGSPTANSPEKLAGAVFLVFGLGGD